MYKYCKNINFLPIFGILIAIAPWSTIWRTILPAIYQPILIKSFEGQRDQMFNV